MPELSADAQAVMRYLVAHGEPEHPYALDALEQGVNLHVNPHGEALTAALGELRRQGLVETLKSRTGELESVRPKAKSWAQADASALGYDVRADKRTVAKALLERSPLDGEELRQVTGLTATRINVAVCLLDDDGGITVIARTLGPYPYAFVDARSNFKTRKVVDAE